MQDLMKMIGVLTLISVLAGGLLAVTNRVTRSKIAATKQIEKLEAMRKVLPEYDNDPVTDLCAINTETDNWVFYLARLQGKVVGVAFEATSDQGYSGAIRILAGITVSNNAVRGVEIIEQIETPGLGAKIAEPAFTAQFQQRDIANTSWAVTKDGGDIHAITGATISPRAVVSALKNGLDVYTQNKTQITQDL